MQMINLKSYDWIVISSSAGKDSQAMLSHLVELADAHGVSRDKLVVVHSDLGRVEWEGTGELAARQAAAYGLRFEIVSRIGGVAKKSSETYKQGEVYGDLLDYAERRGAWPSNKQRWCTSEFKRGPISKVYTQLAKEWKKTSDEKRACRILDCQGLRAQESPARAKKPVFKNRKKTANQIVDTWLPIHAWTTEQVWSKIKESGVEHHRAYDLGMSRLSCAFCIFAPKSALLIAGKHNPELLDEYVKVEKKIDHTFRQDLALADIKAALDAGAEVGQMSEQETACWTM